MALTCALASAISAPAALAQTATPAMPATMDAGMAADASLYRALGEKSGIDGLTDDFVVRLKADPRIGAMFQNTDLNRLSRQLADQFCMVSGGPCKYSGADMQSAHANLDVRKGHFNALVEDLQAAMDARKIPFATQNQLLAKLAPMHRDIIAQ